MGVHYSAGPIVRDGLVLCLDAANPKSYPGSGTTWRDLSGNDNDVTLVNNPTFNLNNIGYFDFDSTNEYGVNTSFSLSSINSGASVSGWINTDDPLGSGGYIVSTDFQNNSRFYIAVNSTQAGRFQLGLGESIIISNVFADRNNNWEFISLIAENGNYKFYVNAALSENSSYTQSSNPLDKFYVGNTFSTSNGYRGLISQVSLYNRALTPQEIQQNYNATKGRFGL